MIKVILIILIVGLVFDSGFVEELEQMIDRALHITGHLDNLHHFVLLKPFSCSFCMTFWCVLVHLIICSNCSLIACIAVALVSANLVEFVPPILNMLKSVVYMIISLLTQILHL